MQLNELQTEFDETFSKLNRLIANFDEAKINLKPAENKWSAAQIARHLIMANSGFPMLVSGETEEPNREPDEMIEKIKGDFLNFDLEMNAPDFIVPEEQIFDKAQLVSALEEIKSEIDKTIGEADMNRILKAFEFPVYGYLTGLEMLAFTVYHTQRHIHQLEKVSETV